MSAQNTIHAAHQWPRHATRGTSPAEVDQHAHRRLRPRRQRCQRSSSELDLNESELRFLERKPRQPTSGGAIELHIPQKEPALVSGPPEDFVTQSPSAQRPTTSTTESRISRLAARRTWLRAARSSRPRLLVVSDMRAADGIDQNVSPTQQVRVPVERHGRCQQVAGD